LLFDDEDDVRGMLPWLSCFLTLLPAVFGNAECFDDLNVESQLLFLDSMCGFLK
jgi:hypothetical protein